MPIFKVQIPWLSHLKVTLEAKDEKDALKVAKTHANPKLCHTCGNWLELQGPDEKTPLTVKPK